MSVLHGDPPPPGEAITASTVMDAFAFCPRCRMRGGAAERRATSRQMETPGLVPGQRAKHADECFWRRLDGLSTCRIL
ncbi:hypothetical protein EYF80_048780 [Liparis tanakae]|uniref:Uncharacterized protein n=1 Tax=Liparis tanakae TaxID=230148 RepID=A0A4Z2FJT6_9TELE|nr:hypothetical protein EYF80_048780 [Liparis tanakae]